MDGSGLNDEQDHGHFSLFFFCETWAFFSDVARYGYKNM
jgi:hypothetical protein